jgi:hypothetical protein
MTGNTPIEVRLARRLRLLRIVTGFVFAPLAPLSALAVVAHFMGGIPVGFSTALLQFGVPLVYAVAVVLGMPAFAILRWRRWEGVWAYLAAGAVIGVVTCAALAFGGAGLKRGPSEFLLQTKGFMPFVMACTLIASAAFWGIVRPDRFDGAS